MATTHKKSGYIECDHGKLYFEVDGEGDSIIFIHGFTLDHRMWEPQVSAFHRDYQVCVYDIRGFGRSSFPTTHYKHHLDLYALLKHLGINKAHLVGLSFGGEVAIDFALEFPEMVKSLTLLDSSLSGFTNTVDWNVHAQELGVDGAKENWLNHPVFATTRKNKFAMEIIKPIIAEYSGWHWFHAEPDFRVKLDPSAHSRLQEIDLPTRIITGEYDLSYFQHIAQTLHENIRNSEKRVIRGAGHMVNLEKPEEVNALIKELFVH